MIRDHRFYEMQSALSATGHLTGSELEELEQHVTRCASCRNCMVEMAAVSRELFLTQVQPSHSEAPRGMQRRFIERAVAAGIPLKHERAEGCNLRFARVAAIIVLLALLISLGWKVDWAPRLERASGQFPSQTKAAGETISNLRTFRGGVGEVGDERRTQRRVAVRGRAIGKESRSDLTAGVQPTRDASFTRPYAASLLGRKWDGKPEERSFHLDFTLASLSRSGSPLNTGATTLVPKFSTPAFPIDPSRN